MTYKEIGLIFFLMDLSPVLAGQQPPQSPLPSQARAALWQGPPLTSPALTPTIRSDTPHPTHRAWVSNCLECTLEVPFSIHPHSHPWLPPFSSPLTQLAHQGPGDKHQTCRLLWTVEEEQRAHMLTGTFKFLPSCAHVYTGANTPMGNPKGNT